MGIFELNVKKGHKRGKKLKNLDEAKATMDEKQKCYLECPGPKKEICRLKN